MQVFLIRHPRPRVAPGICYGQLDLPVIDLAEVERTAAALRAQLPSDLPVISSPLQRCRLLAEALHRAPRIEAGLMEMHFGDWEGMPWEAIGRAALDAWAANLLHHAPPGGESAAMLQARSVAVLNALAAEGLAACAVVTHAGVMRSVLGHAFGQTVDVWAQRPLAFGECVSLTWPPGGAERVECGPC